MWIIYDVERAGKRRISNKRTRNIDFRRGLVGETSGRSLPGMKTNNQFSMTSAQIREKLELHTGIPVTIYSIIRIVLRI
jgi:hypothetical protein